MKTRTFTGLAALAAQAAITALALASSVALSAQVTSASPSPTLATLEEHDVPAEPSAPMPVTLESQPVVPTPEAGAVQQPADTMATSAGTQGESQEIVIRREAPATTSASDRDGLPKTASPLALFALLGLGSGGTAAGLRMAGLRRTRRRR